MSTEIEKKYRLPAERRDAVVKTLKEIGAVFERVDKEENTVFGGGVLQASGGIIRIRRTQSRALLTFKRRIEGPSDVKLQTEHETEISDPEAAQQIVRELGLEPRLVYEKLREIWRRSNVEVVIDDLPFGLFMEIEGSMTGIRELEMLLGIDDLEIEHETYPSLTARLGKENAGVIESRFD